MSRVEWKDTKEGKKVLKNIRNNEIQGELNLRWKEIGENDAVAIAESLKVNTTLAAVDLANNNIGDNSAIAIAESLKVNTALQTLNLFKNKIGVNGAIAFAESLKVNTTLANLDLNNNKIGENGALAIAESLKVNATLTTLSLYNNNIGDNGVVAIAESLKVNTTLTNLDISNHGIGDDGAIAIAESLKQNTTLTTVNLSCNNIGDNGAIAIAKSLKVNTTLIALNLNINKIGENGGDAIAKSLKVNITLTTLHLYNNNIDDSLMKTIKESIERNNKMPKISSSATSSVKSTASLPKVNTSTKSSESSLPPKPNSKSVVVLPPNAKQITEGVLKSSESMPWGRSLFILTGPGRVGKTSFFNSCMGKDFDPHCKSTIGANMSSEIISDRSNVTGNWAKKAVEGSEFAGHLANAVASRLKAPPPVTTAATAPRRSSITQSIRKSITRVSSTMFSSSSSTSTVKQEEITPKKEGITMKQEEKKQTSFVNDDDVMKVYEDKFFIDAVTSESKDPITVSIYDLGGQKVFYALHHLYLSKCAAYANLFDMRDILNETKRDETIEYINFWLRSIQLHAPNAPVFLIGTFKDVVSNPDDHSKINLILAERIKLKLVCPSLVKNANDTMFFWPVDNTKSEKDPVIVRLRTQIMETIREMEHIKRPVPLTWTRMYDKFVSSKKKNITFTEALEQASRYGITSPEELNAMLELLHDLGMILYFPKSPELKNLIIIEPQWLIDALTMVIRDFHHHPYEKDLEKKLLYECDQDYLAFKTNSIVNTQVMNMLWKDQEDGEFEFTRRHFLISLMSTMMLSSPWPFNEIQTGLTTRYLIPCNLHLQNSAQVEAKINKAIPRAILDQATDYHPQCFVIDFRSSFLPFGFFDRLICLSVTHAGDCFPKDSRIPLLTGKSVLMGFGMHDFRADEDVSQSRIVFTIEKTSDAYMIYSHISSMLAKLQTEVTGSNLTYSLLLAFWDNNEPLLVDMHTLKDAIENRRPKIKDINSNNVIVESLSSSWAFRKTSSSLSSLDNDEVKLPSTKMYHAFMIGSLPGLNEKLSKKGITLAPSFTDSVICFILVVSVEVFQNCLDAIEYAKNHQIKLLLVSDVETPYEEILKQSPLRWSNVDTPFIMKSGTHEEYKFILEMTNRLNRFMKEETTQNDSAYVGFLSHYKAQCGPSARVLHTALENHCKVGRVFLDSDCLVDLRQLMSQVASSKRLVILLSSDVFFRPWCLAEMDCALKHQIPIILVDVREAGFNRSKALKFLSELSVETLDRENKGASSVLFEQDVNIEELGKKLFDEVSKNISLEFNANAPIEDINFAATKIAKRI